ncbi:unnamed protein product (macronuclear) [Paramecium tetraurelia]|uniref:EGF-like domain-containing protein n=1 Tax=Paramecium tetraurelia TaxID=5888 RepID=A0EH93_PARTE|nr:uncharacterized protein GSPATT00027008001 [Paramecium tetraurelia]CAK94684.1 unnamed protein product [Paramecium tetraurelia]|eukprot:XP_001462057.1 hypothetical protein (macronuclear) [Paramecium tetraurelia strain d4-2]
MEQIKNKRLLVLILLISSLTLGLGERNCHFRYDQRPKFAMKATICQVKFVKVVLHNVNNVVAKLVISVHCAMMDIWFTIMLVNLVGLGVKHANYNNLVQESYLCQGNLEYYQESLPQSVLCVMLGIIWKGLFANNVKNHVQAVLLIQQLVQHVLTLPIKIYQLVSVNRLNLWTLVQHVLHKIHVKLAQKVIFWIMNHAKIANYLVKHVNQLQLNVYPVLQKIKWQIRNSNVFVLMNIHKQKGIANNVKFHAQIAINELIIVFPGGQCVCQFGYFLHMDILNNKECQQCSPSCESCQNESTECLTCLYSNQFVDSYHQCVCKEGFFFKDNDSLDCTQCGVACQICDNTSCQKCINEMMEIQDQLSCVCPKGYQFFENNCFQCQLPCSKCIDQTDICIECLQSNSSLNENKCICDSGFGLSQTSQQYCSPCQFPCLECSSDVNLCTRCSEIGLFYLENSKCRCPSGYFMQGPGCIKCSDECQECNFYPDYCLNCRDLNYEFKNNGCFCPFGYYVDNALKCSKCQEPCQTCQQNSDFCLSCVDPLYELINNSCQCPISYFQLVENNNFNLSAGCHTCNEMYLNCIVCNLSYCQQCQQGYRFNENQECLNAICGDSIIVGNEQCEDGNDNEFDGCFQCQCELGWIQNELGCQTICGDQVIVTGEQCDDGNEIQFDGCYQCKYDCNESCIECIEGRCIKCKEGFQLEENECSINCGDGILNVLTEQCDDSNNIPRDGCNNCHLEDGFICYCQNELLFQSCERCSDYNCLKCAIQNQQQVCQNCIDGYFVDATQGCSQCDKICLKCTNSPKNCEIFDSSIQQLKDCNQKLGFYYDYQLKDCVSKCGDGIISGQEQCDDLNTNDFDGCNNQCQIESGYLFNLNSLSLINEPFIQVQSQSSSNNQYSIYAEQFQDTINCTGTTMNIEQFNQTEYNYTIIEQGLNCDISMQYFKTVEPSNLIHVLIKFKNHLSKRTLDESPTKEIVIVPKRQVYATEEQKEQGEAMASTSKSISSSIVVFAPLALLIGGFKFIWAILDIMSWMNNFYFLNVQYPENVRLIFQQAEWNNIINFPEFDIFNKPSDEYYFQAQIKFTEKDVDPLFFNNVQIVIIFVFQVLITWLICFIIRKTIQAYYKKKIRIQSANHKIFQLKTNQQNQSILENEILQSTIQNQITTFEIPNQLKSIYFSCLDCERSFVANMLKTIQISYLDILLAIILQITNQQTANNSIVKINVILASLSIGIVILLIYLSYQISVQHHLKLENQHFSRRFNCFYEDVKTNSKISMNYSFLNMLRKTIFIIATVILYDFPIYQTSVCFLSCFLNIILLMHCNPFNNRQQYILNFIPDSCICIIVGITITFAFQDQFRLLEDDMIYFLGWIVGACIYLSILLQLLFLIKELIQSIWEKIRNLFVYLKKKFNL